MHTQFATEDELSSGAISARSGAASAPEQVNTITTKKEHATILRKTILQETVLVKAIHLISFETRKRFLRCDIGHSTHLSHQNLIQMNHILRISSAKGVAST